MNPNKQFQDLLEEIVQDNVEINTRNSLTLRKRNLMTTFDKTPLISLRRTAWKNALREFEWFMSGSNDINDLHKNVRKWWKPWSNNLNKIPNNYSKQFRRFSGETNEVNQIEYLKDAIKNHPYSRRSLVTTWNTADMIHPDTPITNCHGSIIQTFVEPDNSLHLTMYQRSADMVLGVPHNFIQYWAFLQYLAHHGKREVGTFTWIGGDCHIYDNHIDMAKKIIKLDVPKSPNLVYNSSNEEFLADDFSLDGEYAPIIKENLKMTI